ncbi:MAG: DUF1223 domain-containing protein [Candidatus Marinimicrobia bacterium]|nr:DUF1223 domain-containing protein [Candidatus Neomarinimicrobiota bacterium]
MKYLNIYLAVLLLVASCDWTPQKVHVDSLTTFKTLEIVKGINSVQYVEGHNFILIKPPSPEIVDLINADSGRIEIVGKTPGITQMGVEYLLGSDSEETLSAKLFINIEVSNGIPLNINVRDTLMVEIGDYLDEELQLLSDSFNVQYSEGTISPHIEFNYISNTNSLEIVGINPGEDGLIMNFFDNADTVIASLAFEIESTIKMFVLAEMFTNSGCVNCPEANGYLDNIYSARSDQLNVVRYHVSWTDPRDPMNLYNPTEVMERVLYYNAFFAPSFIVNGILISSLDENDWINRVISAASSKAELYLSPIDVQESNDSLFLEYALETFGVELGSVTCWSLVLEDSIEFAGSNGEDLHMQVMRDMISSSLSNSESASSIQHSLKKPDDYGTGQFMSLLIFVQSDADKSILQSRKQYLY